MARTVGPIRLSWNANSEGDLAGYKLYVGRATETYTATGSPIDVGNVTSYPMTISDTGDWFFAVTAYDEEDNESEFSAEVEEEFVRRRLKMALRR
jgi:hypothetical protein